MREGQFPEGSMGPKIEAAIHFVERTGREALITSPEKLTEALAGKGGTRVVPDAARLPGASRGRKRRRG
jgi:carbamate kinase